MTQRSLFWDGSVLGDCGPYTQSHLHDQFFRCILNGSGDRGVCRGWRNELLVSGTSSPVSVAAGGAVVYGMLFDMDAATTVNIPTPSSGNSRYDRIVVQRGWAEQTVRIVRVSGVAAIFPSIPSLTQAAGTYWQIPLATVLIDDSGTITLTDSREWCAFPTELPANIVTAGMFEEGAVTAAKIPNRTRYELKGAKQLRPDSANPATWIAGPSYDYWEFTNGVTDGVWSYWMGPTGIASANVTFYLWNGPTAVAAGDVKWDYDFYHGPSGGALTNTSGTVAVIAQGGRAIGNVYRDTLVSLAVGEGQIIAFHLTRDGGHGTDTYGSPMWAIGLEMSWTADA